MNRSDSEKRWCQKVYEYLNKDPKRSREEGIVVGGELLQTVGRGSLPKTSRVIATLLQDNRFSITKGKLVGAERVYLKSLYNIDAKKTANNTNVFTVSPIDSRVAATIKQSSVLPASGGPSTMKQSPVLPASGVPSVQNTRPSDITLVSTMKSNVATYESLIDNHATINSDGDLKNNNIVYDDEDDDDDDNDDADDDIEDDIDGDIEEEDHDDDNVNKGTIPDNNNVTDSRLRRVLTLIEAIGESENDTGINNITEGFSSPTEAHGGNGLDAVHIIKNHRKNTNKKEDVAAYTAEDQFGAFTTFADSTKDEPRSVKTSTTAASSLKTSSAATSLKTSTAATSVKTSSGATLPSTTSTFPPILGTFTDIFLGLSQDTGLSRVSGHLLDSSCSISTRASCAEAFVESTLLGLLDGGGSSSNFDADLLGIGSDSFHTTAKVSGEVNFPPPRPTAVYLNTHEPFCFVTVGVQGGGKSHTLGCVLESCLVPVPEEGICKLSSPMSALVLHFDPSPTSVCEVTGLIKPSDKLLGGSNNLSRNLPREKMIVLVSPSFYKQRKAFYGDYCEVRPLLFSWSTLTADHLRCIMQLTDADNQLYVATLLNILQGFQREAVIPKFEDFLTIVKEACNIKGQEGALSQRLSLLSSIVRESKINKEFENVQTDLEGVCLPGNLVVVDLTDPLLAAVQANGIFQVLVEQFRSLPLRGCGKVLALDEAHKFMDGQKEDGLSHAIVTCARLIRHDGLRLLVSTQSPKALAPELLELVSVCAMHRFHSRDWWSYLEKKLYLPAEKFATVSKLQPGQALVFASRASLTNGSSVETDVFTLRVRQRVTADRGATRKHRAV